MSMLTVLGSHPRLDAMIDRVLDQRLQHERRHQGIARHPLGAPFDLQPLAEPELLQAQILAAQFQFARERRELPVVVHQHAK